MITISKYALTDIAIDEEEAVIYAELLALNPESPLALFGLGKLKLFEQDFAQAEELLMSGTFCALTRCCLLQNTLNLAPNAEQVNCREIFMDCLKLTAN